MPAPTPHVLTAGSSWSATCGVRDYDRVLRPHLEAQGVQTSRVWWERDLRLDARATTRAARAWLERLTAEAEAQRPDWILLHYTAFMYAYRGIPMLTPVLARTVARTGVPTVPLLHELTMPFTGRGWRGITWASLQRPALRPLVSASAALITTTEDRARWLRTRWWLPRRTVACVPVFSNLPDLPRPDTAPRPTPLRLAVFGFGGETLVEPVVSALTALRRPGADVELVLVGAPGAAGPLAERWRRAAARAGCDDAVSFTGVLAPDLVVEALDAADVVVFPDAAGPSARKTTLAASLARGRPVVAFAGGVGWPELVAARAVEVVPPSAAELARVLSDLIADTERRTALGTRARAFYERRISVERGVASILELLLHLEVGSRKRHELRSIEARRTACGS
jgi:glycosyltransferase involved in cell wall biosynthesis